MNTRSARQPHALRDDTNGTHTIHVAPETSDDGWLIVAAEPTRGGLRFWLDVSTRLYDLIVSGARVRLIRAERELVREELCRAEICALGDGCAQISIAAEALICVSRNDGAATPRT